MAAHKVGDQYRLNELSVQEGGTSLTVYQNDGKVLIYDKIKSVEKYINSILNKKRGSILRIVDTNTNHQYYPNVEQ
jgi:hypothetical protein